MVTWAKTSSYYNEWFYEQVPHLKFISSDNNKMFYYQNYQKSLLFSLIL